MSDSDYGTRPNFDRLANKILRVLDETSQPVSESHLQMETDVGSLSEYTRTQVAKVINQLQIENRIRWVAFEGWVTGGRPS